MDVPELSRLQEMLHKLTKEERLPWAQPECCLAPTCPPALLGQPHSLQSLKTSSFSGVETIPQTTPFPQPWTYFSCSCYELSCETFHWYYPELLHPLKKAVLAPLL